MKCDELEEWYAGQFSPSARVYGASEVDAAIDELKTEHHKERHEYIEMVAQLRRENRRLKRALYKACANWAHHRVFVRFKTNEKAWENVERKCREKAEEYK